MEKNKYLKYCKYYKGEKEPPAGMRNSNFWILERAYVTCYNEEEDRKRLQFFEMCLESFPETKDYIMSFEEEFVRIMLANFVILSYSHTPQSGVDFIFDYDREKKILLGCRYYKGELTNPFSPSSIKYTFWMVDKIYATIICNSEIEQENIGTVFSLAFPDLLEEYAMPTYLKATLYTQYLRFGGSDSNFRDWLNEYLNQAP